MSDDVLASPGGALASARLRLGVGLDEMSRRTRVPRDALEAIEADDWTSLPGTVYVRGFIRLYAKEVGFDPERSIRQFDAFLEAREARDQMDTRMAAERARAAASRAWRVRIVYGVAFGLLTALVVATLATVPREPPAHALGAAPALDADAGPQDGAEP